MKRSHVKQTQARQSVFFQQALVNVLFLQLLDLGCGHLAPVGCEFAIGLGAHGYDFFIRSGGQQRGEKFFFQHREMTLQVFQP